MFPVILLHMCILHTFLFFNIDSYGKINNISPRMQQEVHPSKVILYDPPKGMRGIVI